MRHKQEWKNAITKGQSINFEGLTREEKYKVILRYCKYVVGSIVDGDKDFQNDVVSQTILSIIENEQYLDNVKYVKAWLYKMLKYRYTDMKRIVYYKRTLSLPEDAANCGFVSSIEDKLEAETIIRYANTSLSRRSNRGNYEKAKAMRDKGISVKEIAKRLSITGKHVYKILNNPPNNKPLVGLDYLNKLVSGYSVEEIAIETNQSETVIHSSLFTIRTKIREQFKQAA